jgi:dolichyl-phosphate beta-glucosyltransferase
VVRGARPHSQHDMDRIHAAVLERFHGEIAAATVRVHRAASCVAASTFPNRYFDWVYLDGDHTYDGVCATSLLSIAQSRRMELSASSGIIGERGEVMGPSFTVVIPAYNEEARIEATLHALMEILVPANAQLIVVDDGSRDATAAIAERRLAAVPHASVLRLARNTGKGAAVRAGVQQARGDAVVYMDADLASDRACLPGLLAALDAADVVVGSRTINGSKTIGHAPLRAVMARAFNTMARPVMKLPIRDTQCGFKAFRADAARTIFGAARANRFAFDVEVLTIARVLEMRVVEVPVTWTAVEGSQVRLLRDPLQMTIDLARIALRCRRRALRRAVANLELTNETADVGAARPPAGRHRRTV